MLRSGIWHQGIPDQVFKRIYISSHLNAFIWTFFSDSFNSRAQWALFALLWAKFSILSAQWAKFSIPSAQQDKLLYL